MAFNNLRIIYKNLADSATITSSVAPSGVTSIANLKKDSKSLVCRTAGTSVTYTVTLSTASIIGGVILPFCNLTSTATINVTLNTGYTTGNILTCPYQNLGTWDWGSLPLGVNSYSYGGGTYGRVWFPQTSCTSLTITISDSANTSGYLEFSRLVVGAYWSPKYNTSFGMTSTTKDLSSNARLESGDLVSNNGIRFNAITFDLKWLDPTDRNQLTSILKGNGVTKPLLISLFPDNSEDWGKEQNFQVYGKIPQVSNITHTLFGIYSSQIEIEEI